MLLQPRKSKYRKQFRGKMGGRLTRGASLAFGEYGLKSLGRNWLTSQQIEAARVAINHYIKRQGKLWIRVFPDKPITSKGSGVGMGAGKGEVKGYVAVIKPGKIVFELAGVSREIAQEAMRRAGTKLPFKTKFVEKSI